MESWDGKPVRLKHASNGLEDWQQREYALERESRSEVRKRKPWELPDLSTGWNNNRRSVLTYASVFSFLEHLSYRGHRNAFARVLYLCTAVRRLVARGAPL